jgi:hypothetical protein
MPIPGVAVTGAPPLGASATATALLAMMRSRDKRYKKWPRLQERRPS